MKHCLKNLRKNPPLIHCITNYVTANDVANALLAIGASPIMADDVKEVQEITAICSGLYLNIGTLNSQTIPAMFLAGEKAKSLGHSVLLDPVGAGASSLRTQTALDILQTVKPQILRGNISEIKTLAKGTGTTKGVDADIADAVTDKTLEEAVDFAKGLSQETGSLVVITGAIDLVADANRCFVIRNGRPEMGRVTGTGCQLSAILTAFVAANPQEPLLAAAAAVCTMGIAGEMGHYHLLHHEGNAAYRDHMIDALFHLDGARMEAMARYEIR